MSGVPLVRSLKKKKRKQKRERQRPLSVPSFSFHLCSIIAAMVFQWLASKIEGARTKRKFFVERKTRSDLLLLSASLEQILLFLSPSFSIFLFVEGHTDILEDPVNIELKVSFSFLFFSFYFLLFPFFLLRIDSHPWDFRWMKYSINAVKKPWTISICVSDTYIRENAYFQFRNIFDRNNKLKWWVLGRTICDACLKFTLEI